MRILCVGDVVGTPGLELAISRLPALRRTEQADFIIVNGENSDKSGVGLPHAAAEQLLQVADVVTTGNHCHRRADESLYTENPTVLHPANYPYTEDAAGCCEIDTGRLGVLRVINLAGVAWMEPIDSPFTRADALLAKGAARFTVVDVHAESTAEKKALAFYLDGRVSAVFGTHTHVQTADEQILPGGTGYITDVGMTGPSVSVIGIQPQLAVKKQREHVPVQFKVADGPLMLNAVLFTLDDISGLCVDVRRIYE
ncbi:MAG: YmdB family metallophosphoesterase [Ruminococcaceae bacterium]|nr:YmdB family metallophosphoesterase [Oscillospiraceae bacterium]